MRAWSALRSLRSLVLSVYSWGSSWLPACVPALPQLTELQFPYAAIDKAGLQMLAALPQLQRLTCGMIDPKGEGRVYMPTLTHLSIRGWKPAAPAELAALSFPQLKTVLCELPHIELKCEVQPSDTVRYTQMLADTETAAAGLLQWLPDLHLSCVTGSVLHILTALRKWQPVQRGGLCSLTLECQDALGPTALTFLPPAIQHLV
jgi:hypothetical protein